MIDLIRVMHGLKEEYDLVIVGAGLSGAVVAEQVLKQLERMKIQKIEIQNKRNKFAKLADSIISHMKLLLTHCSDPITDRGNY